MADWIDALREACDSASQRRVSKLIGYSATTINQVLKDKYTADIAPVRAAVELHLMQARVDCPVLGEIALSACMALQSSTPRATNPLRLQLAQTCPMCQHRRAS